MPRVLCINEGTSKMLNEFYPMRNSNSYTNNRQLGIRKEWADKCKARGMTIWIIIHCLSTSQSSFPQTRATPATVHFLQLTEDAEIPEMPREVDNLGEFLGKNARKYSFSSPQYLPH